MFRNKDQISLVTNDCGVFGWFFGREFDGDWHSFRKGGSLQFPLMNRGITGHSFRKKALRRFWEQTDGMDTGLQNRPSRTDTL